MKIIREHSHLAEKFPEYFGATEPKETKLSWFTHCQEVAENKVIFYNFISDAIVMLSKNEYQKIVNKKFSEDSQIYSLLKENGFFVGKDVDEAAILSRHRVTMQNTASETMKVVILPTTECNARCRYCIAQKNQRIDMTLATAEKTIEFITKASHGYKNVSFNWYGGEPLLKHKLITMMCKEFKLKVPEINYTSVITTNLVLFNDEILDSAVTNWHIRKINITFDGAEQEHNSRKKYLDKTFNGYKRTVQHIEKLLAKGINVHCRFNVDKNNINDLSIILHDIKHFLENELFFFFVSPLRSEDNVNDYFPTLEYNEMTYITNSLLIKNGVVPPVDSLVPKLLTKFCLAKSKDALVIGADGAIYRCNLSQLNGANATGSVSKGVVKNEVYNDFMSIELQQECFACKFLPICQGGCLEQRKNISETNSPCNKFIFKIAAISKILTEHYAEADDKSGKTTT
ncbi:MAG: SPASM domain-containing protein [Clostridiaceae bacterium]|jgi:radical SAM protein with 4Fe4S-binding SPASM domain|nr:SPASM domain-containing protein [Clostridiaceae bacterium]